MMAKQKIHMRARTVRDCAMPGLDPFGLDDPCPRHRDGHEPIETEDAVVCAYCAKIFWSEQ